MVLRLQRAFRKSVTTVTEMWYDMFRGEIVPFI